MLTKCIECFQTSNIFISQIALKVMASYTTLHCPHLGLVISYKVYNISIRYHKFLLVHNVGLLKRHGNFDPRPTLVKKMACRLFGTKPSTQCWAVITWTLSNQLHWNLNLSTTIFIQVNLCIEKSSAKRRPFGPCPHILNIKATYLTREYFREQQLQWQRHGNDCGQADRHADHSAARFA